MNSTPSEKKPEAPNPPHPFDNYHKRHQLSAENEAGKARRKHDALVYEIGQRIDQCDDADSVDFLKRVRAAMSATQPTASNGEQGEKGGT